MAASQPLQAVTMLMLETGARPEEICQLTCENINLDQGYISVPYGKTKAARRKIPLNARACGVLEKRLAEMKDEYLFAGGTWRGRWKQADCEAKQRAHRRAQAFGCEIFSPLRSSSYVRHASRGGRSWPCNARGDARTLTHSKGLMLRTSKRESNKKPPPQSM